MAFRPVVRQHIRVGEHGEQTTHLVAHEQRDKEEETGVL